MSKVHNLKSENIECHSEVSTPVLSEIIEKIQLTDQVSGAERPRIRRWLEEQSEEILEDPSKIIEVAKSELSEVLSSDAMQFLIDLLSG